MAKETPPVASKRRKRNIQKSDSQGGGRTKRHYSPCQHCRMLLHRDDDGWWVDGKKSVDCEYNPVDGFHEVSYYTLTAIPGGFAG